jgi:serine/threonine-protein kinase
LALEIDSSIGDYRLIKVIGSGACGEVFQAEHLLTRRVDAIKLLTRRLPGSGDEDQAILREIELQAGLQHPNIAAVHNAFRVPEGLALVMELIEGEPLSAILDRGGVSLCDGARYVLVTLDALAYAHERRVVHRDVKPANIMVTPQGSVKLTDFGLARSLDSQPGDSGIASGSPYYMSPEQVVGDLADARSDCYSVGAILFEIATGRKPFVGETSFEIMLQQRNAAPTPPISLQPGIGAELNAVILKALEKAPARRFQSAGEFRSALESALATWPAMQQTAPVPRRRSRIARVSWAAAAALAGMALSSAVLIPSLRRNPLPAHAAAIAPAAPAPVQPAAVPPTPVPVSGPVPEAAAVTEPKPTVPIAKNSGPARPTRATPRARSESSAVLQISPPEPAPSVRAAAPAEVPAAPPPKPEVVPAAPADPPVQQAAQETAPHDTPVAEPAKRPGLLRRALGRIARPFSKKPDKP